MSDMQKLTGVLAGERDSRPGQFPHVYSATVTKRTASSLHFTLDDEDTLQEFGPAAYARPADLTITGGEHSQYSGSGEHTHTIDQTPTNLPPKGTKLAVAFASGDPDRPLVLALYGWP